MVSDLIHRNQQMVLVLNGSLTTDFPQTVGSYVHRIGRAGRAGRLGSAITYFTLEDGPYLRT